MRKTAMMLRAVRRNTNRHRRREQLVVGLWKRPSGVTDASPGGTPVIRLNSTFTNNRITRATSKYGKGGGARAPPGRPKGCPDPTRPGSGSAPDPAQTPAEWGRRGPGMEKCILKCQTSRPSQTPSFPGLGRPTQIRKGVAARARRPGGRRGARTPLDRGLGRPTNVINSVYT